MRKFSLLACTAFMTTCFATGAMAVPTTISFGSNAGAVGQTKTYSGLITLSAYYVTNTDWTDGGGISPLSANTQVWERNVAPNDIGVGICNPGEGTANCISSGTYNEISSNTNIDIMKVSVAAGWKFVDMTLASVEPIDHYMLYGTNAANPDLPTLLADISGNGSDGGGLNPFRSLVSVSGFTTLYLTGGSQAAANDFMLQSISVDTTGGGPGGQEVPEPASLALLGVGLLGLGLAQRRRPKL